MPHASGLRVGTFVMPKGLKRYYGKGDLHFLTFSCYQRLPLLGTVRARNIFVQALGKIRERYGFLLVGYVVMPNHVHLLISETDEATPSVVLKVLKQRVSRDLRKGRRRGPTGQMPLRFARSEDEGQDIRKGKIPRRKTIVWGTNACTRAESCLTAHASGG